MVENACLRGTRARRIPDGLISGKEHEAAETLQTLCQHFLGSLSSLLEGL